MGNSTATPSRIRRCIREAEFATVSDLAVYANRLDAEDGYDRPYDSFFTKTAHAQAFLNQRFAVMKESRRHEAAETDVAMQLGQDILITPAIPRARMRDLSTGLDRVMTIKAISKDLNVERHSIETIG